MTRGLYSAIFTLLLPFIMLRLLWRSRLAPAYRRRWRERFGRCPWRLERDAIWIHAVSVGEVEAALPLIESLRQRHPEFEIIVTTTTPTGSARLRQACPDDIRHAYVPYDLPLPLRRFISRSRPRLVLIMETEIWPNLLWCCESDEIPVAIINARLSERSANRYGRLGGFMRQTLNRCRIIACQDRPDAQRFAGLGVEPARIEIMGNLKFDRPPPPDTGSRAAALGALWSADEKTTTRPVWLAASTHDGEEADVITAFEQVRAALPDTLLVIVPRHPERFAAVESLCRQHGLRVCRRSTAAPGDARQADVVLGDTMGELLAFYAAADVAFVGGSLVATGGHNVLEAAAMHCPIVFGPHMFNFATIAESLLERDAAIEVGSARDLGAAVIGLLGDSDRSRQMAAQAYEVFAANHGALDRALAISERLLRP